MSIDIVKHKSKAKIEKVDIEWSRLISDAEAKIRELRKSIRFFKKEAAKGRAFPV